MSTELQNSADFRDASIYVDNDPYETHPEIFAPEDFQDVQACTGYLRDLREVLFSKPDEVPPGTHERILKYQTDHQLSEYDIAHMTEVANALSLFGERIGEELYEDLPPEAKLTDGQMYKRPRESYEGLKPFARQVEYYVLRYLHEYAQVTSMDFHKVLVDAIYNQAMQRAMGRPTIDEIGQSIISETFEMYRRDIPIYEYVYEGFDQMREDGDKPLEVYLGRDGVYAFHGRRGQVAARKSLLDPQIRAELKATGELEEMHPKYTYFVFNRPMAQARTPYIGEDPIRANANERVLERYIHQEFRPDDNPHFYDTGYTGSIPIAIMQIMGFDPAEIDKRIHLLSTNLPARRVRTIPEDKLVDIRVATDLIEDNQKDEHSAKGVTHEGHMLRHVARPTSVSEQLHFIVARDAIMRHFWIAERKKARRRPDLQTIAENPPEE